MCSPLFISEWPLSSFNKLICSSRGRTAAMPPTQPGPPRRSWIHWQLNAINIPTFRITHYMLIEKGNAKVVQTNANKLTLLFTSDRSMVFTFLNLGEIHRSIWYEQQQQQQPCMCELVTGYHHQFLNHHRLILMARNGGCRPSSSRRFSNSSKEPGLTQAPHYSPIIIRSSTKIS